MVFVAFVISGEYLHTRQPHVPWNTGPGQLGYRTSGHCLQVSDGLREYSLHSQYFHLQPIGQEWIGRIFEMDFNCDSPCEFRGNHFPLEQAAFEEKQTGIGVS